MTCHIDPYKTANELRITDQERESLIVVGRALASSDPNDKFAMVGWTNCIYGKMCNWRVQQGEPALAHISYSGALSDLFIISRPNSLWPKDVNMVNATREDAALAVHKFLIGA